MPYICFFISLLSAVKFNVIGELNGGELVLFLLFPFQLSRISKLLKNPPVASVFYLGILYLFSLILADILNGTLPADYLRGWAKVGMMMFAFLNLGVLLGGREKCLFAYILGSLCTPLLSIALYGYKWDLYKFYIGFPISMVAFLLAGRLKNSRLGDVFPFAAGGLALAMNSRSLAGMTCVAAMYNLATKQTDASKKSQKKVFANLIFIGLSCVAIFQLYIYSAPKGLLGEAAKSKFEMQSDKSTGDFSLLSGRSELFFSVPKIIESPFIGHGSWAKDMDFFLSRSQELGMTVHAGDNEEGLIPSHSHFFGAWVEAGLFGAIFWGAIGWKAIRGLARGDFFLYRSLAPVVNFVLIGFMWDICFSPFGGSRRVQNAFLIWILIWPEVHAFLVKKNASRKSKVAMRTSEPQFSNLPAKKITA